MTEQVQINRKDEIIREYLNDPKTTGGRDRLFNHIRSKYSNISRRDVAKFLANDETHQIHKPLKKRQTVRPIIVSNKAKVAQIDLIDMQSLKGYNGHKRYILTYIDIFSKYVEARALLNKKQGTVLEAVLDILSKLPLPEFNTPSVIQSDNGAEFQTQLESALNRINIKLIHSSPYTPQSQGVIERFNRTLKSAIFEYMTRNDTNRYIDVLPLFIENFNNTIHSTTNHKPIDLMNELVLRKSTIEKIQENMIARVPVREDEKFQIGDYVRVAVTTNAWVRSQTFRKKIKENWTKTVYEIYSISSPTTAGTKEQYLLKNTSTNRKSKKRYFAYQLQKTQRPANQEIQEEPEVPISKPRIITVPSIVDRPKRGYKPSELALMRFAI